MKLICSLLAVLAAVTGQNTIFETAFNALEQNMAGGAIMVKDKPPEIFLKAIDTNGDKRISMAELKKLAKDGLDVIFKLIDGNMDGILTGSEIRSGDFRFAGLAKLLSIIFTIFDSNADGYINTADGTTFLDAEKKEMAKQFDTNNDGRITLTEFREKFPENETQIPEEAMKVYKLLDRNEDSQLSKKEIENFLQATFKMIDKNSNGLINGEEAITALEKHGMKEEIISAMRTKYKGAMMVLQNKNITDYIISKLDGDQDMKVSAGEFKAVLDKPVPTDEEGQILAKNIKINQESVEDNNGGAKSMDSSSQTDWDDLAESPTQNEMMAVFKSALTDLEKNVVSLEKNGGILSSFSSWILVSVFFVMTVILHF